MVIVAGHVIVEPQQRESWEETPLDVDGLESWRQARLGQPSEVHIVSEHSTIGFARGPIDWVMRFESDDSHGLILDGRAGAWSLELAAEDFVSAQRFPVPESFTSFQLLITLRQHRLMLDPC